ncbi:MAG: alpha/beta hydrolase [Anaerolineales bacterium]|nr:alpha/beta hydrolase [Anaerolineales bacterium]
MDVKKVSAGGQQIAYYESEGTGPNVILIHGNSCSSLSFKAQLEGEFGQKYHVVSIDLPGHGESDPAADPEATYHMPGYAAVVAEVAKQVGVEDAVLVGWSLGGHIALEAASLLPNAAGFVIFGTPPLAYPPDMDNAFQPNPAMAAAFAPELTQEQMEGFAAACLAPNSAIELAPLVADIARTDGRARATMAASIAPGNYADEIEIVQNLDRPLAILHGEDEQLVNGSYISALEMPTLWRGEVQIIPGAGHTPQMEAPEQFSALVGAFVDEVTG